jgi:hypothetical protein
MAARLEYLRRRRLAALATLASATEGAQSREAARAELAAVDVELDSYGESGALIVRETNEAVSRT